MQISFLFNRLLRMSLPEVGYRFKQTLQAGSEYFLRNYYTERLSIKDLNYKELAELAVSAPSLRFDLTKVLTGKSRADLIAMADRIVEQKFTLFALTDYYVGPKVDYHKDYASGKRAPHLLFGKSIDYRATDLVGDIKYIWEINRQQFLLPLAFAYRLTGEDRYLASFHDYLLCWLKQNPFLLGVNWSSTMEMGIRLLTWSLCWLLLSKVITKDLKTQWLDAAHKHCWFINRNLSAFSSANNHLLGEVTGLWAASLLFPAPLAPGMGAGRQKKWQARAYRIILREWNRQQYKDGVNKEQALWYEHQVLDYGLLAGLLGECYGRPFPPSFWQQLEQGLLHLAAMLDAGGHMPVIGDTDSGLAIDLGQADRGVYQSLLNTGAALFENPLLKQARGEPDAKTLFLLAFRQKQAKTINPTPSALPGGSLPVCFNQGGYYLLGTHFQSAQEQKLVFDCGSLGYLSIAAHGHADALGFVFSAFGEPVFIDAGSYAYHTEPAWRTYFRSTLAHNTVRVAGEEQSVMAGSFMWSTHARTALVSYTPYLQAKGTHDGYRRLAQRVRHSREIRYNPADGLWEIEDQLLGKGHYQVQIAFHCAPDCQVTCEAPIYLVDFKKGLCLIEPPAGLTVTLHRGEERPPLGWYAPAYQRKEPVTAIIMEGCVNEAATYLTRFRVKDKCAH